MYHNLTSNTISFNVVEQTPEQKDAYEMFLNANKLLKYKTDFIGEVSIPIFQEILENYPNTFVAEKCMRGILTYGKDSWLSNKDQKFDFDKFDYTMLSNFPNSGNASGWIGRLVYDYDGFIQSEILKEIISLYPNTRAARFAKQKLMDATRLKVPK